MNIYHKNHKINQYTYQVGKYTYGKPKIKWWNWDDNKINKFTPLLCNKNIDNFINSAF